MILQIAQGIATVLKKYPKVCHDNCLYRLWLYITLHQLSTGIASFSQLQRFLQGFSLAGDNMLSDADRRTIANFMCHCDLKFKLAAPAGSTTKFRLHRFEVVRCGKDRVRDK